ncbi:MAG: polyketide synthase dehydratase domain-containing protein, partial [Candidatus Methylomirabilales bacterium]
EMQYLDDRRAREKGLVLHGPRFRCLRQVWMQSDGGWGRIIAPPLSELGEKRGNGWIIPAAVLDACLVACGVFANTELKVNQLPLAFKRLRIDRLPRAGEHCTVRLNLRGRQDDSTYFDFALFGNDGTVILVAEGHRCVILSNK